MLRTYIKYLAPWQQIIILLAICIIIGFTGTIVTEFLANSVTGYNGIKFRDALDVKGTDFTKYRSYLIMSQVGNVLFMFIIPAYIFAFLADPKPFQYLKSVQTPKSYFVLISCILVLFGLIGTGSLSLFDKYLPFPKSMLAAEKKLEPVLKVLTTAPNALELIVNLIVVALFAAISEELLFRGVLQRIMIQWTVNPWIGIVVTALLFSLMHLQSAGFLTRFSLGIILGALYWFSGSIYVPILYHFLHNSIGVIAAKFKPETVNKLDDSNVTGIAIAGIVGLTVVIVLLHQIYKNSKVNYANEYPPQPSIFEAEEPKYL